MRHIKIDSADSRWADGATTSPPIELRFFGHGGEYKIVYDWHMALPDNPGQAVSSAVNGWGTTPWHLVQRRFPVHYWTDQTITAATTAINVISKHSGKCLDVRDISGDNGTMVQQWDCLNDQQKNQMWTLRPLGHYYQIVAEHSGKCLDVAWEADTGGALWDGARVQQWECYGGEQVNQLWAIRAVGNSYHVISAHSGKCLDVAWEADTGDATWNGVRIQQWECVGSWANNQLWDITFPKPTVRLQMQLYLPLIVK